MVSEIILVCLLLAALAVAGILKFEKKNKKQAADFPYVSRGALYKRKERKFLGYLVRAVGENYFIMGKVRVADLIGIKPGLSRNERRDAFEKICYEKVDFLLTDRLTTKVVAAIKIYDSKMQDAVAIERSLELEQVFRSAEIPLILFLEREEYRISEVKQLIEQAIAPKQTAPAKTVERKVLSAKPENKSAQAALIPTAKPKNKTALAQ